MSDSLEDAFDGLGDGEFKDQIWNKYDGMLKNQEMWGEELDVPDMGTSVRQYDHGQASEQKVKEYGVKIVFDSEKVELSELEEGGSIRAEIELMATDLIEKPVDYVEVSFVTDESYELWVVLDADSL